MAENTNLAAQLKQQMLQENATIQDLTKRQLNSLRSELTGIFQQELNTIKADIQSQSKSIGWSFLKSRFLWPTLVGLSLCLGIFGGSWGMMRYYTSQISVLQANVQKLENNVQFLEQKGGKIQFSQCGKERRLCAQIDENAQTYRDGYRILKGY